MTRLLVHGGVGLVHPILGALAILHVGYRLLLGWLFTKARVMRMFGALIYIVIIAINVKMQQSD